MTVNNRENELSRGIDDQAASVIGGEPVVSIVTPSYNQHEYLEATMRSVLGQDYRAVEYIVVDDGSTDGSLELARRISAEFANRVTIVTQPNSGQASALNKGWSMARGDILAYLSSDDLLLPSAVSQMVHALRTNPNACVAYCDFRLIDASGKFIRDAQTEEFDETRLCVKLICQPGPGAFFRREIFDNSGGWNPAYRQVPDFEFWLRSVRYGSFLRVAQCLAEYRIHEGSGAFKIMSPERADEIILAVREYWSTSQKRGDARQALARANAFSAKNHAQSGRFLKSITRFARAATLSPTLLTEKNFWRLILSGTLRRLVYKLRYITK